MKADLDAAAAAAFEEATAPYGRPAVLPIPVDTKRGRGEGEGEEGGRGGQSEFPINEDVPWKRACVG